MRITAGKYKNRTIACPKGVIRPAMDRMRESVFSILGDISDLSFLDVFSGSGLIGIEAASRGASPVTLVEKDRIKRPVIYKNISFVDEDIDVKIMSAEKFLAITKDQYDLIFLDPPFPMKNKAKFIELISKKKILREQGFLLIHHPSEDTIPESIDNFIMTDERTYGRSIVKFYSFK